MTPEALNPQEPDEQPPKKSTSGFLSVLALMLALIALIGVAYVFLFSGKSQIIGNGSKRLKTKTVELTQAVEQLKATVAAQQKTMEANRLAVTKLVGAANNGQQRWLFAETEYLLKMANITLQFRHNVPVTIALLKTADQRLFDIGDPKLYPVRERLANDIATLEALPKLDMVGTFLRLQALRQQAEKLPLSTNRFVNVDSKNLLEQYQPEKQDAWHNALHATSKALGKFLVVRRRQVQIEPLVSPQQNILLKQNIYLLFSQAQWGLLNRQNKIYQNSLAELEKLMSQFYADNSESTQVITVLQNLAQINVAPQLPDISGSLDALRKYEGTVEHKSRVKENQTTSKKTPSNNTSSETTEQSITSVNTQQKQNNQQQESQKAEAI